MSDELIFMAKSYGETIDERDQLRAALDAATQRAEAAEAKLARVDEYGVFCWNNAMAAERDGYCDDDLTFEQWLAKRREAQP